MGLRESIGQHDRQAAGAGAQFQDIADSFRILQPWGEVVGNQFGDERTRHDHALVDVKAVFAQPGFIGNVSGRNAIGAAFFNHLQYGVDFMRQQARVEKRLDLVQRQLQRMQDQVGRLIQRVAAAVAEEQAGGIEAGNCIAQQVADGGKGLWCHGANYKGRAGVRRLGC